MSSLKGAVVWITGGGTGIGLATAVELARQGAKVAVSGRRLDRLSQAVAAIEAVGGEALAVACDVVDEASLAAAVAAVVERWGRLDVAIANAGFGVSGKIATLTDADWRRQFDTNVFGALNTVRAALPELEKTGGRMVLIGSVAGFVSAPKNGAYNASKAAIRAIGETFSAELAKSRVTCTTIHPGFVESEIGKVSNDGVFQEDRKDKRPPQLMWKTEDAARVMVRAIAARKREFIFTGHGKIFVALSRLAPGLVAKIATRL